MSKEGLVVLALVLMMFMNFTGQCYGALQFGFYDGKCNGTDVENIVEGVIVGWIKKDPSIVAALLRMQFHDCFSNVRNTYKCYI